MKLQLSDPLAVGGNLAQYIRLRGTDLLGRTAPFEAWIAARRGAGLWPYSRSLEEAPRPHTGIRYDTGEAGRGVNFASQDYLSLASHERVRAAARAAIDEFGVHSAGSAALLGNTRLSLQLEQELAQVFRTEHVTLFPTGWAAGYGAITGLVRPSDHVVMDELSHACLQAGARAATPNLRPVAHLDTAALRSALTDIRSKDAVNGILVVTEGLFSMDSDTPNIAAWQEACREFDATLLVDVAHDFGSLGPGGSSQIGTQDMLGKVDLVMGSFSKTFASNGGFVASHQSSVKQYLKSFSGPQTFSNALSPVQAAIVREALAIVRSDEGDQRRQRLRTASVALRSSFAAQGIQCLGEPSAIVPVPIGREAVARVASRLMFERGVLANLVEFPAVAVGAARFRMQVMADHEPDDASHAAEAVVRAFRDAEDIVARWERADSQE